MLILAIMGSAIALTSTFLSLSLRCVEVFIKLKVSADALFMTSQTASHEHETSYNGIFSDAALLQHVAACLLLARVLKVDFHSRPF